MARTQIATRIAARILAGALLLGAAPFVAVSTPAAAQQFNITIGFNDFHNRLAPYGDWYRHPRWGDVWHPTRVGRDFRPFDRGYWENTREYGWLWVSDDPWGDIPSHYGRWVYDPYDGWLWIPGYVWSPAWVVWRTGGGYVGWFPMPPDDRFLRGDEIYRNNWDNWDRGFGYADWYGPQYGFEWSISLWNFVDQRNFGDRNYRRWTPPLRGRDQFFRNTRNTTNYITINNYIVNRSIDNREIERSRGRAVATVSARDVFRNDSVVTRVDVGRQIQDRERRTHGGNTNASPRERIVSLPPNRAIAPENRPGIDRPGIDRPGFDRPGFDRNDNRGNGAGPGQDRGQGRGPGPDVDRNPPGMPDRGPAARAPAQEDPRGVTRGLNPRQDDRPQIGRPQVQQPQVQEPPVQRGNAGPQGPRGNEDRNPAERNRRMPNQANERPEQVAPAPAPNVQGPNRVAVRPGNPEPAAEAPQAERRMPNARTRENARENANDDDSDNANANDRQDRRGGPERRGNNR